MSRSPTRDFLVGLFLLVGLGAVAYLSISVGGLSYSGPRGFTVFASFDEIGGLKARAPVVISGVKIGQVKAITLGTDERARVELDLDPRIKLPADTTASIVTAGLLGDRYISLQLGGEEQMLKPNDSIGFTESAVLLERMIGKLIHNADVGSGAPGKSE